MFSVCCCDNLNIGYTFSNVHIVQIHETQNSSDQSCLQQIKEVGSATGQEDILSDIECTCKIQWYTILMVSFSLLGLMVFAFYAHEN